MKRGITKRCDRDSEMGDENARLICTAGQSRLFADDRWRITVGHRMNDAGLANRAAVNAAHTKPHWWQFYWNGGYVIPNALKIVGVASLTQQVCSICIRTSCFRCSCSREIGRQCMVCHVAEVLILQELRSWPYSKGLQSHFWTSSCFMCIVVLINTWPWKWNKSILSFLWGST